MRNAVATQEHILAAALNRFSRCGYAGTSVQDIVDAARVTKPTLYYYYPNKARLYQALVDSAHDERLRLMREAAARGATLAEKLAEILAALFEYTRNHRELMRVAFATAFASPDERPREADCTARCKRNFDFIHGLIKRGLADGTLDRRYGSRELAAGIYGLMNVNLMTHLISPEYNLDRPAAEQVVQLFLSGAAAKSKGLAPRRPARRKN